MSKSSEKKSPTLLAEQLDAAEQQQPQQLCRSPQETLAQAEGQSPPQHTSTSSLFAPPARDLSQVDTRCEIKSRCPHMRLQDLSSATDLKYSLSHSHITRPLEIVESIKGLHELHRQGGLTQEEFTQAKQQILDSGSSATSLQFTKSHRSQKHRHRRHGRRGSGSSDFLDSCGKRTHTTDDRSYAKTRNSRHRSSRKSKSTDSSSSSTSSDSSDDRFIVVPRANVWRSLNARLEDGSTDHDSAVLHLYTSPEGYATVHAPLLTNGSNAGASHTTAVGEAPYPIQQVTRSCAGGYESIPGDDPLSQRSTGYGAAGGGLLSVTSGGDSCGAEATVPSTNTVDVLMAPFNSAVLAAGSRTESSGGVATAAAPTRQLGSLTGSDNRERAAKYGTFLSRDEAMRGGLMSSVRAELNREDVVRVKYFNSRGRTGNHFSDVELHASELRERAFLHKGKSQVMYSHPPSSSSATRRSRDDAVVVALPAKDSQACHMTEMTPDERKAWEEIASLPSRSSTRPSSKSSYLEQILNWYWIDVTGRDPNRKRYNATLRYLTHRFKLCESFLVDRDHMLVLPQVCESPNYPGQYLLNLRVATDKIAISDDSVLELTNRWIIVVDLKQHVVITLHRVDTHSMANLRMLWRRVIENNNVSFQEFLLKIIDDAIHTYQTSIDVHADILDKCEAKLFVETSSIPVPVPSAHYIDMRILHHFAGSSRSLFLRRLLDNQDRSPMNKGEMNSFLHHLHRRTSVQHRMLNLTQTVLVKAFTKLRLCSKEMADQMCASCVEVSDRALEVRDDAKTLLDLHISLQSFRTNELMAVLTRVSLLFTPVTFLAGVYGMNFQKNFPELTWEYGYPCFWVLCIILVFVMQIFFLRKR